MSGDLYINPETRADHRLRWWGLIGASLAVFMAALDSNVVNVALPIMATRFNVTRDIRWVSLSYLLPTTALLGAFGALSDVVGRKRVTLSGVVLFILGSVLCGTAQTLPQMIVYRVIQGIGGSAIGSAIMAIATVNFAPGERGRAMSVVGLIAPLGAVVGPSVGGLLIGSLGWPSIFFINVPFGIISFALIMRFLPKDQPGRGRRFDVLGAVMFSAAVFFLLVGLAPGGRGLTTLDYVFLGLAAVFFASFALVERRAEAPLVPPPLVGRPRYTIPLLGIIAVSASSIGVGFLMPFFLEGRLGYSPERAGFTLLFFPFGMAVASQIAGRLIDRFRPSLPAYIGAVMALGGLVLLLPLSASWTMMDVALRFLLGGFGTGLFLSPINVAVMAAAPQQYAGVGGALVNTARYLGFALGPTMDTIFWNPGSGAAAEPSMRVALLVLIAFQALALASVAAFTRVRQNDASPRSPGMETRVEV